MAKIVFTKLDKVPVKPEEDRLLHGTGITKKLMEKDANAVKKAELAAFGNQHNLIKQDGANFALKQLEDAAKSDAKVLDLKSPDEIVLDEFQTAAIAGLTSKKHGVLIGSAGTGKTTIEKKLIQAIEATLPTLKLNETNIKVAIIRRESDPDEELGDMTIYSLAVIAFTGRAVQQSKRSLPEKYLLNCMTGHKCLGYAPVMEAFENKETNEFEEKKVFRPTFTEFNKLPYTLIIIDEASMFPVRLFNELIAASKPETRFIFVGDINQLPPVQDVSVLPFAMLKYKDATFELKKIHRQAADNPIIANAHRILSGQLPVPDKKHFIMKLLNDGSVDASSELLNAVKQIHQKGGFEPIGDALIVQSNKGVMGKDYLNMDLMNYFNGSKTDEFGAVINRRVAIKAARGTKLLAVGDKMMALANDNDLGITNGMTGVITDITINGTFRDRHLNVHGAGISGSFDFSDMTTEDLEGVEDEDGADEVELSKEDREKEKDENQRQASHITTIKFGTADGEVEVKLQTTGQYAKFTHGYAITCHKSQGGEYPNVIIGIHSALARMCTREWLYTAVTRARNRVFLFHNNRALTLALKNQAIKGQTIEEKANSFLAHMENPDKVSPNLPEQQNIGVA